MHLKIPPPVLFVIAALGLYLGTRYLPTLTVRFPGQGIWALFLAVPGIVLDGTSVVSFFRQKTTVNPLAPHKASKLVTNGFYRITRNPMYLGLVFLLLAISVYLGTLTSVLIVPAFVWYITEFQIKPEESRLSEIFGDRYQAYTTRVRRWL